MPSLSSLHFSLSLFCVELVASMMRNYIQVQHSTTALVEQYPTSDAVANDDRPTTIDSSGRTSFGPGQVRGRGRGRGSLWPVPAQTPEEYPLHNEKRVGSEVPTVKSFSRRLGSLVEPRMTIQSGSFSSTDCEFFDT